MHEKYDEVLEFLETRMPTDRHTETLIAIVTMQSQTTDFAPDLQ